MAQYLPFFYILLRFGCISSPLPLSLSLPLSLCLYFRIFISKIRTLQLPKNPPIRVPRPKNAFLIPRRWMISFRSSQTIPRSMIGAPPWVFVERLFVDAVGYLGDRTLFQGLHACSDSHGQRETRWRNTQTQEVSTCLTHGVKRTSSVIGKWSFNVSHFHS